MEPLLNKQRALNTMRANNVDVLVATMPENVLYASGFRSLSQWLVRGRKTLVLVVLNSNGDLTLIAPAGELDRAACDPPAVDRIIAFDTVTIESGHESQWSAEDHRYAKMAFDPKRPTNLWEALATLDVMNASRIAIDDPDLAAACREHYSVNVIDGRPLWQESRMLKTPAELTRVKHAVAITEQAIQHSMDAVRVGISERELGAVFEAALLKAGGKPYLTVIGAGTFGAYPNHIPGNYRIKKGDLIRWDVGAEYEGYVADIARTACVGEPNELQFRRWQAVLAGQKAALDAIQPGIAASDIYRIGMDAVRHSGLPEIKRKHIGHGVGIDMYEPPSISPHETLILEPGMVFELEVLFYEFAFGSTQVEDTIHITQDGYECFTTLPHELFIVGS
uniref:Xaa-Pro aminopeptidase n=1 Tax=Candidatus Kentrum sp. MB TaxID=2138164 RepID=A0A451BCQ0_9GAMM|nr:MAG: Xaa-Pro aminopeptidase [Candidatus Kentron sp. MB]VFK33089.1 MAG: Xaa-Pro aminopeptidase [Candidatus Kentron sp. MB]VFK76050.1 MAG: Xaa-Pro aminopeptidase [Candidatus Kentron sp. MB]